MENNVIETVVVAGGTGALDFTIWNLFWRSDMVIKLVMVVLVLASIWCWTIIVDKVIRLRRLRAEAAAFEDSFWAGGSLDDLYDRLGGQPPEPMSAIFSAAMAEWRRSRTRSLTTTERMRDRLQERIDRVMEVTLGREIERLERHLAFLASAGATAPFIGLFGTVWGIMNSFQAIALAKNTNLAVVGTGLGEALFTTALGLIVAVPAVAAYNKLRADTMRYGARLESFASEFSGILSRHFEEKT